MFKKIFFMIDIQNINGYGLQDPGFELLRQVAQKYCPEELQAERREVLPDEALDLSAIDLFVRSNLQFDRIEYKDLQSATTDNRITNAYTHGERISNHKR